MSKQLPIYGIKNCDTVRKSLKWLEQQGIDYQFHDLKKEIPSDSDIEGWLQDVDRMILVNRRGLTWRKLDEDDKALLQTDPIKLIQAHPTLLKRPLVYNGKAWQVGFKAEQWQQIFA